MATTGLDEQALPDSRDQVCKVVPATPLPWGFEQVAWDVYVNAVANRHGVCRIDGQLENRLDDAAYIVHAANAYPKLVAALRHVYSGELLDARSAAFRALRELGELPR